MSVDTFTSAINQLLPEPHAGLLAGIVFGTKTALAPWLKDALITTGTIHIAALSGMNITILMGFVSNTLLWLVGRRISSVLTVLTIIGFVWLVGPSPTIVRAAIMGAMSVIAVLLGRQYWALVGLGIASIAMIVVHPSWLGELSFQLSFLATLGIILFGSSVSLLRSEVATHCMLAMTTVVKNELRITLAAQVFTIPLILFTFHRISLVSPLTNVLIAPAIPIITVLGLCTSLFGVMWLPLGYPCAWGSWVFLNYVMAVVWVTSRIPFASIGW